MSSLKSLKRILGACTLTILAGALAAPAHARVSLSDLEQQLQELQNRFDTLVANPCPEGKAIVAVQADGTPVCAAFGAPSAVEFSFDFTGGTGGIAEVLATACPAWQNFIADTALRDGSITVSGSDGAARTCSDPSQVAAILAAMNAAASGPTVGGNSAVIACDGYNWSISNFCASGSPGAPQVELKVSPDTDPVPGACACQGAGDGVYVVRPCIGNQNWGGVGTNVCNAPSQTMTVTVE